MYFVQTWSLLKIIQKSSLGRLPFWPVDRWEWNWSQLLLMMVNLLADSKFCPFFADNKIQHLPNILLMIMKPLFPSNWEAWPKTWKHGGLLSETDTPSRYVYRQGLTHIRVTFPQYITLVLSPLAESSTIKMNTEQREDIQVDLFDIFTWTGILSMPINASRIDRSFPYYCARPLTIRS